ncbi:MAG: hypothetical protein ACKVPY_13905 [Paracoccaceae bacterium]
MAVDAAPILPFDLLTDGRGLVVHARFGGLNGALIDKVRPDCVAAPLVGNGFDALDVIQRLNAAGFCGILYVLTSPIPELAAIVSEIGAFGAAFDVVIAEIGDEGETKSLTPLPAPHP